MNLQKKSLQLIRLTDVRDVSSWSQRMKQPMIDVYGESYFEKTWHDWVDVLVKMSEGSGDGDTDLFTKVRCFAQSLHTRHFLLYN